MPRDPSIRRVLVIGSGPIVIGQAAEFDYAGTQACRALQQEGIEVVLINSNPATIMTDSAMADKIYIEPLTKTTLKRVIEKEQPDSMLSTLGGQIALTLSMQLAKEGFLKKRGVRLLGANPETIDRAEDRQLFKDTMESIGQPVVPSAVVRDAEAALAFAGGIGYPVIVRPAFTLGGSGGGIADDEAALSRIAANGLRVSPIGQILVEKSVAGWKEIEFEVMRDGAGNAITVCSMENIDPVGIHTGDSIVVAPALTLSDKEYQMLRSASLDIIAALRVEGGCNCQFALDPRSFGYAVIEVNPRVSRSSALASKATGYPIAKVATEIAIGYRLDEIKNAITRKTYACFEPTLDYVALKFPKWPFDKFAYSKRRLGTQMQATGEVMAIADSFEAAMMKAVRGAEISLDSLRMPRLERMGDAEIRNLIAAQTDERIFAVFEALARGVPCGEINAATGIDMWFLDRLLGMARYEQELRALRGAGADGTGTDASAGDGTGANAGAGAGTGAGDGTGTGVSAGAGTGAMVGSGDGVDAGACTGAPAGAGTDDIDTGTGAGTGTDASAGDGIGAGDASSGAGAGVSAGARPLTEELYARGKRQGYPDRVIERLSGSPIAFDRRVSYKMVDTCGGEFQAETPYFYSTYAQDDEAAPFIARSRGAGAASGAGGEGIGGEGRDAKGAGIGGAPSAAGSPGTAGASGAAGSFGAAGAFGSLADAGAWAPNGESGAGGLIGAPGAGRGAKGTVAVLGSGPIRIGQGIEFDYSSVHCAWALRKLGYDVVIINNNPETVSTDFDTADRLYFEPLTPEDVEGIIAVERPIGVVVAFGGQTAIGLTKFLHGQGIPILGTQADGIDMAEDRERFEALLERLSVKRPKGMAVSDLAQAERAAAGLGYPVLIRPSYVLGGQNMTIAFGVEDVREYMALIRRMDPVNPVLIDKYLQGIEIEVDAICDGKDILIPGVMEHVERTGIHSGDSIALYPAIHVQDDMTEQIVETTRRLALPLGICGLVNIQYIIYGDELYVIEVNPRASRTVPYISKVTGVPMAELATRAMLGEPLSRMGYGTDLYRSAPYIVAKVPVFSFEKLDGVDTQLGPEMKSTGETLGIGKTPQEALYKGLTAAGYAMSKTGGVFLTVRDGDKHEILDIARKFADLSFSLYATKGTAAVLEKAGLAVTAVGKIHESEQNSMTLLESGKVQYIVSTSAKGRDPALDSAKIRRKAVALGIPCLTSIDTANAVADSIRGRYSEINTELVDINNMRHERMKLRFTKMQACGNDYLYINCLKAEAFTPESLAVALSDRHYGVGGDGIVLIERSKIADARMRVFNLDGSEGEMSGNAIRCVGKYLYDNGIVRRKEASIETLSGAKKLRMLTKGGLVSSVEVDMGPAALAPGEIPVLLPGESVIGRAVSVGGIEERVTCLSMGNPHCVLFCARVDDADVGRVGPIFENAPIFPERANVEFVEVVDERTLRLRTWERGSGETMACGTGACAAAVAAVENGFCRRGAEIRAMLRGGDLAIRYTAETVLMAGAAEKVFEGVVEI